MDLASPRTYILCTVLAPPGVVSPKAFLLGSLEADSEELVFCNLFSLIAGSATGIATVNAQPK